VVNLAPIVGIGAYNAAQDTQVSKYLLAQNDHDHDHTDGHAHDDTCTPHYAKRGISSVILPQLSTLDAWVRSLLWEGILVGSSPTTNAPGVEVLRCKGTFSVTDGTRHVLQGVRSIYEITAVDEKEKTTMAPEEGKLVLIGKGLDPRLAKESFGKIFEE
jgi:G3E family GTPase